MTEILSHESDLLISPWTTGIDLQFGKYPFNEHQFEMTRIINLSPELLSDIERARQSLREVEFCDDSDIFGD